MLQSFRVEKVRQDGTDDGNSHGPQPEVWIPHEDFYDISRLSQGKHGRRGKGKGIEGDGQRIVAAQGKASKNGIEGVQEPRRQSQGECRKRYGQMPLKDAGHEDAARDGTHQGQPFPARHGFMEQHCRKERDKDRGRVQQHDGHRYLAHGDGHEIARTEQGITDDARADEAPAVAQADGKPPRRDAGQERPGHDPGQKGTDEADLQRRQPGPVEVADKYTDRSPHGTGSQHAGIGLSCRHRPHSFSET